MFVIHITCSTVLRKKLKIATKHNMTILNSEQLKTCNTKSTLLQATVVVYF